VEEDRTDPPKKGDGGRMEEPVDGEGFCPVEEVWIVVALTG
jgi:hypothetical protein